MRLVFLLFYLKSYPVVTLSKANATPNSYFLGPTGTQTGEPTLSKTRRNEHLKEMVTNKEIGAFGSTSHAKPSWLELVSMKKMTIMTKTSLPEQAQRKYNNWSRPRQSSLKWHNRLWLDISRNPRFSHLVNNYTSWKQRPGAKVYTPGQSTVNHPATD